jgi:hypothetical protein
MCRCVSWRIARYKHQCAYTHTAHRHYTLHTHTNTRTHTHTHTDTYTHTHAHTTAHTLHTLPHSTHTYTQRTPFFESLDDSQQSVCVLLVGQGSESADEHEDRALVATGATEDGAALVGGCV